MLVNVKLDASWQKGLSLKVAGFSGLFNFEWHSQNEIGNAGTLVLWRDHNKSLYRISNTSVSENNCITRNDRTLGCTIICKATIYNAILFTDLSRMLDTTKTIL